MLHSPQFFYDLIERKSFHHPPKKCSQANANHGFCLFSELFAICFYQTRPARAAREVGEVGEGGEGDGKTTMRKV